MVAEFFLKSTGCPRCSGALNSKSGRLHCGACHCSFPELHGVPWLFAFPEAMWADWRGRVQFQLQTMASEVVQLQRERAQASSALTARRLERSCQGLESNLRVLSELLKPLAMTGKVSLPLHQAVKSQLPLTQKLMGYYTNLHRDWSWGEAELRATHALVERVMGGRPWGKVLVLGAGAGRLAYDLAWGSSEVVVALDHNPLLVSFGQAMSAGKTLSYTEFPVAPLTDQEVAVRRECKAPHGPSAKLLWLLADGMNPPFQAETFDTVITPWFIDVIPCPVGLLAAKINNQLRPGGTWLNFGPYGFLSAPPSAQFSPEEIFEVVRGQGFALKASHQDFQPYLQSPSSAQRREENVLAFVAEKTQEVVKPASFRHYPEWLENLELAVPRSPQLEQYHFANQVQSQVLALVDGRRSIEQVAMEFGPLHQLEREDALTAVVTLLRQLLDRPSSSSF